MAAYGTALHSLKDRAQLKSTETVVVTGASGGVGLAAIDIARSLGARVIACVGHPSKVAPLYARGVEAVIDLSCEDLKTAVMANTKGSDLPLNVHPATIRASADLLRYPSLDRRKLEFSGFGHAGGLDAPARFMREAGGLLPIAPCGLSSL